VSERKTYVVELKLLVAAKCEDHASLVADSIEWS